MTPDLEALRIYSLPSPHPDETVSFQRLIFLSLKLFFEGWHLVPMEHVQL